MHGAGKSCGWPTCRLFNKGAMHGRSGPSSFVVGRGGELRRRQPGARHLLRQRPRHVHVDAERHRQPGVDHSGQSGCQRRVRLWCRQRDHVFCGYHDRVRRGRHSDLAPRSWYRQPGGHGLRVAEPGQPLRPHQHHSVFHAVGHRQLRPGPCRCRRQRSSGLRPTGSLTVVVAVPEPTAIAVLSRAWCSWVPSSSAVVAFRSRDHPGPSLRLAMPSIGS